MKLKAISATIMIAGLFTGNAFAADCSNIDEWDRLTVYTGGDRVQQDGQAFTAEWWTKGNSPATNQGQWHTWGIPEACDSSGSSSSSSSGGDGSTSSSSSSSSGGDGSTSSSSSSSSGGDGSTSSSSSSSSGGDGGACGYPKYAAGTKYVAGDKVEHAGYAFTCLIGGWCSSTAAWAYAPETGAHWDDAWDKGAICSDDSASSSSSSSSGGNGSTSSSSSSSSGGDGSTSSSSSSSSGGDITLPAQKLPERALIGYWHNFDNGSGYIPLGDVSRDWDVINLSFAENKRDGARGEVEFVLCPTGCTNVETEAAFKASIKALQKEGKIINISLGGANAHISLNTVAERENFIRTLGDIIAEYGLNGLDIDLEGGSMMMTHNDTISEAKTPMIVHMIEAIRALKVRFGDDFILTMAPETAYVQGGYQSFGGIWGAYLPLIDALRDDLDLLHVQHYNTGSLTAINGMIYYPGTIDFHVALSDMMITGFQAGSGDQAENYFEGLRADQVAFGLPSGSRAAGNGFTSIQVAQDALSCLIDLKLCDTYTPDVAHTHFRGLMTWSINWDRFDGYNFSAPHRAYLDTLK